MGVWLPQVRGVLSCDVMHPGWLLTNAAITSAPEQAGQKHQLERNLACWRIDGLARQQDSSRSHISP